MFKLVMNKTGSLDGKNIYMSTVTLQKTYVFFKHLNV